MKNGSPKAKVLEILIHFNPGYVCEVRGTRIKGRFGGDFLAEAVVRDNVVARARHRNWRRAYKDLEVEVSKAFVR